MWSIHGLTAACIVPSVSLRARVFDSS